MNYPDELGNSPYSNRPYKLSKKQNLEIITIIIFRIILTAIVIGCIILVN